MRTTDVSPHGSRAPAHARGRDDPWRALTLALGVTLVLMAVEAIGGWLTGSLALLADAGHLFVDVGSLAIGIVGCWLATRPPTARMSYGYRRAEILAAVTNGIVLWGIAAAILYEAVQRLRVPHPVLAPGMLIVALLGLAGNIVSTMLLGPARHDNLNVGAAFAHVRADAAAATGTIAASLVILVTGWTPADALVSCGVAVLVVAGAWPLVREAVRILMEATPEGLSLTAVTQAMSAVSGVIGVHDLHIWTLNAGMDALSGHVLIANPAESQRVLRDLGELLSARFGIDHVTLQVETEEIATPWHPRCEPGDRPAS